MKPEERKHTRVNDILLGPLERPALQYFAAHMPAWISPDTLTLIGIFGALLIMASYALTNASNLFLWIASIGFVINWFGDSLDGTLARYRKIERPKYGFFVDHTVDAFSQVLIFGGLGLSPYVRLEVALFALVGYLLMSIYVYVDTYVSGTFKLSYGKFGPTEMRAIAVLANTIFFFLGIPLLEFSFGAITVYDLLVLIIGLLLFVVFVTTITRRARELSRQENTKTRDK